MDLEQCWYWASLVAWFNSWVRKIPWRRVILPTPVFLGFPCSSAPKESACNAGDLGSVPRSRRSPGEGLHYPLQYSWASLVALLVKNLPAMWETWVQSLGSIPVLGRSPGEGKGYPLLSLLAWRILWIVTRATNPPQS